MITQATEHPAVLATCHALHRCTASTDLPAGRRSWPGRPGRAGRRDHPAHRAGVDHAGQQRDRHHPADRRTRPHHPRHGVPLHTDAAQAAGKIPSTSPRWTSTCSPWSGTRCTRPKASPPSTCGPARPGPVIYGGGQEHGLRAGTENVALAVALGAAADLARADLATGGPTAGQPTRPAPPSSDAPARPGAPQRPPRPAAAQHPQRQHHRRHRRRAARRRDRGGGLHRVGLPHRDHRALARPDRHGHRPERALAAVRLPWAAGPPPATSTTPPNGSPTPTACSPSRTAAPANGVRLREAAEQGHNWADWART